MFRLRLFGGLALEESSGTLSGKAAQRRRLAVLALLETAPRRTLTRDKLMAMLWADEDAEHARHRLSVVLHELRKVLGDDALRSAGDDVTLNAGLVASDVADFNAAFSSQDYERAAQLYDGPFLDGVYLSGAPEFERWVDGERDRWERMYRTALERLAETHEAAGAWSEAVQVWRRLTVTDAYNTRIAIRYMTALAQTGDAAGALQFARVHELLIQEELRAAPGPELQALVDRLERGELSPAPTPLRVQPEPVIAASPLPDPLAVTPPEPAAAAPRPYWRFPGRSRTATVSSVLLLLALFLVVGVAVMRFNGNSEATAQADSPVVVGVLPFANLSDNQNNEYLSDGLTEEMISALGQLPGLNVPSRASVFAYKARNVNAQQAARELGANYLMEGSVRRAGEQLRIRVSLADAATGMELWSDSYDRRMDDIFDVQREIAQAAVDALQSRLPRQLAAPALRYTTRDPRAYDLYLRGRAAWYSRSPDHLQSALHYFQQAITHDSTYALAYSGIADVYNMLGAYNYGLMPPARAYPQARAAAARALRLEPQLAEAHAALGNYLYNYEWKWPDAERELRRAVALNPGYSIARHWLELVLLIGGKRAEALQVIRSAREQDARSPLISSALAHHYYYRREFPEAIREYHHAIELDSTFLVARLGLSMSYTAVGEHDKAIAEGRAAVAVTGPQVPVTRAVLAYALGRAGQHEEARRILVDLQADARRSYVAPHFLALAHIGLGENDQAITALEAAYNERSGVMMYLHIEPLLDPLRAHPAFHALLDKVQPEKN